MNAINIKIKKIKEDAILPVYATDGAACFDIYACYVPKKTSCFTESLIIGTGLCFEVPEGYVMKIYSRSGHGFNHDARLANCVCIIDSDYRGEVKIKLTKDSYLTEWPKIAKGTRIAQGIIEKVIPVVFTEVEELSETGRGEGGFGSTG